MAYQGDFTSELAYIGVILPSLFGVMLAFQLGNEWLNGHKRLLFNFVLAQALFFNAIISMVLQWVVPPLDIIGPLCSDREMAVICDESATAGLVFVYYFMYDTVLQPSRIIEEEKPPGHIYVMGRYAFLISFLVLSCWGQAYLMYSHISEILIGLCLGAIDGIVISYFLYKYIVPNMRHPLLIKFFRWFNIYDQYIRFN